MAKTDLTLLRRKFRGSMLGVLTGDCLGSPYENDDTLSSGEKIVLQQSIDKLEGPSYKGLYNRRLFCFYGLIMFQPDESTL